MALEIQRKHEEVKKRIQEEIASIDDSELRAQVMGLLEEAITSEEDISN